MAAKSQTDQLPTSSPDEAEIIKGPGPKLDGLLSRLNLLQPQVAAACIAIPSFPFIVTDDERQDMLERMGKAFPLTALKTRVVGGGKQATYVEGATVIRRLNNVCRFGWDCEIGEWKGRTEMVSRRVKGSNPAVYEDVPRDVVEIKYKLIVYGLGSREAFGIQEMDGGADMLKGAPTDGLKKAATLFNCALELYGDDYETPAMLEEERLTLSTTLKSTVERVFGPLGPNPNGFFGIWLKRSVGVSNLKELDNKALRVIIQRLIDNEEAIREISRANAPAKAPEPAAAPPPVAEPPPISDAERTASVDVTAVVATLGPQVMREAGVQATADRSKPMPSKADPFEEG